MGLKYKTYINHFFHNSQSFERELKLSIFVTAHKNPESWEVNYS